MKQILRAILKRLATNLIAAFTKTLVEELRDRRDNNASQENVDRVADIIDSIRR